MSQDNQVKQYLLNPEGQQQNQTSQEIEEEVTNNCKAGVLPDNSDMDALMGDTLPGENYTIQCNASDQANKKLSAKYYAGPITKSSVPENIDTMAKAVNKDGNEGGGYNFPDDMNIL